MLIFVIVGYNFGLHGLFWNYFLGYLWVIFWVTILNNSEATNIFRRINGGKCRYTSDNFHHIMYIEWTIHSKFTFAITEIPRAEYTQHAFILSLSNVYKTAEYDEIWQSSVMLRNLATGRIMVKFGELSSVRVGLFGNITMLRFVFAAIVLLFIWQ